MPASPREPVEGKEGNKESLALRCKPEGMVPEDPVAPVPGSTATPHARSAREDIDDRTETVETDADNFAKTTPTTAL